MPYFEREELSDTADTGWVEIVCNNGANVRDAPDGRFMTWFPKVIRVHKAGVCLNTGGHA
ncbi:MAG: hypothetical protein II969_02135 [Anaerolineaceae bacterium]|nr:hypothetical protein [Anaerolineaceae bacterium]